jgi:hypothetical protein
MSTDIGLREDARTRTVERRETGRSAAAMPFGFDQNRE